MPDDPSQEIFAFNNHGPTEDIWTQEKLPKSQFGQLLRHLSTNLAVKMVF